MHVGNPSIVTQSAFEFRKGVDGDSDTAQDLVRNANEAIDWILANRTSPALTTDALPENEEAVTRPTFTSQEQGDNSFTNIMNLPQPQLRRTPTATLHALQEWEGYVLEIDNTDFTARLVDLTAGASHEEEEAVIPLMEISDDDLKKMQVGSIFRWVIGYLHSPSGTKRRVSEFVFRDLPAFTKSDLRDGKTWADGIMKSIYP